MLLVSGEKINITYIEKPILKDISIYIESFDKIGVIGINGVGKSTLLKILAGVEKPDSGGIIYSSGVRVAYLPQNPVFNNDCTIIEQVYASYNTNEENKVFKLDNKKVDELKLFEAKTILTKLGITDFDKNVSHLSGGQKKRVAIAAALLTPCELLILDEPTNHLDNDMVVWLEKMLQSFNGAVLMVTHDRYFLDRVTNRIVEIDNNQIYSYQANYSKFLELKESREESLIASQRKHNSFMRRELQWIMQGAQGRGTKSKSRIQNYNNLSEKESLQENGQVNLSSISTRLGRKTIEIENISKSFNNICYINDFSYILLRDARIGIIGANGTGKSTLLNIISGKIKPDCGIVHIGETVKIGYFSQESEDMDLSLKVIDYIKNVAETINTVDGTVSASKMLERFLFSDALQYNTIGRLSGGERRRLFLLRVIMNEPNILLLDEPTNDLDIQTLVILEDYLETFNGAVIAVSHDRYFLDKVVDRVFALSEGGVLKEYLGGYSDYINTISQINNETTQKKSEKTNQKQNNLNVKKLKFSFNEQFEYDKIDEDISDLENKISFIEKEINLFASDYDKLQMLLVDKEELDKQLEDKMERWVYLNDLNDKINLNN